jgi:large subunit ribosomal protein L35
MPKQKTHSGAKKRVKVTGTGKLLRRRAPKSHNLEKKSAKLKRSFRRDADVHRSDARRLRKLLGLGGS